MAVRDGCVARGRGAAVPGPALTAGHVDRRLSIKRLLHFFGGGFRGWYGSLPPPGGSRHALLATRREVAVPLAGSGLSVNTIGYGVRPVREVLAELRAHGIERIGVPMAQLESGGPAANLAALRAGGFEVVDTVEPAVFDLSAPDRWPGQRDRLRACVDVAEQAGCSVLYTTTGPLRALAWDEAAARFRDAIAPVAEYALCGGVALAVENTTTMRADLGFAHLLSDTLELADLAGVAVCADLFAAWTDRGLRRAILAGAHRFALVQLADFALGTLATPDRAVPGDGDVPLARLLGWLGEAGYRGPLELELLGPRITAEGPAAAAARALRVVAGWIEPDDM